MYKIIGGDQKEYGPATAEEVRHWIQEGRLAGHIPVQAEGGEWRALSTYPEFAEDLRAQAAATAPPPVAAATPQAWRADVSSRPATLSIGDCLSGGFKLFGANAGLFLGASFMVWLIQVICDFLPILGPLAMFVIGGALYGGLYLIAINRLRGQPVSVGSVFSGFSIAFGQLALVGMVKGICTVVGLFCCFILPGIYLIVAWTFALPLVIDRRLEFWSAMELSRKVVTRVWFPMAIVLFVACLPILAARGYFQFRVSEMLWPTLRELIHSGGQPDVTRMTQLGEQVARATFPLQLICQGALLITLPFAMSVVAYAYESLFGSRSQPPA